MTEEGPLTIAVIGTGNIGMRHLDVLRQISDARPVAVPRRPERVCELEEAGYMAVKNLDEAVCMGATLCIVATDTGRHVEDGVRALESGLDLLVEKPLSTDALQARRIFARATGAERKMFVGCVLRFSQYLNTFRNLLGCVGCLHSVRIECQSYLPDWRPNRPYRESYSGRAGEGGVLRDLVHEIDYAGWLYGWPVALQAMVRNLNRLGIAADEAADLTWETEDGCVISVSLDYLSRPSRRYMRALGELGTLEWDGVKGTVTLALAGEDTKVLSSKQTRDEMLFAQDLAFVNAARGISEPQLATGEDGVKALAVCDAARRAAETRREEKVDYP